MNSSSLPKPDLPVTDRLRSATAESFGAATEDVRVSDAVALSPSSCRAFSASVLRGTHTATEWFVEFDDGTLLKAGTAEALNEVANRCFIDHGALPDSEAATLLALKIGKRYAVSPLNAELGDRLLKPLGISWEPPNASATEDGFVISCFVRHQSGPSAFRLTATVTENSATTELQKLADEVPGNPSV